MFKNYFTIALRNLVRNKVYSIINIGGFSISLACSILILLYIDYELSYDKFHSKARQIYRVNAEMKFGDKILHTAQTQAILGPTLKSDYPEVLNFATIKDAGKVMITYGSKIFYEYNGFYASPSIFEVFDFPFLSGDAKTALSEPHTIVVSETMAHKYFGDDDPIGKTLHVKSGVTELFKITGVLKNIPKNSHLQIEYLISISSSESLKNVNSSRQYVSSSISSENSKDLFFAWSNSNCITYILLPEGINYKDFEGKIQGLFEKYSANNQGNKNNGPKKLGQVSKYILNPLPDIHLYPDEEEETDNVTYLYIFSAISIFILLLTCINYINLATARAGNRYKEIGIRQVLGAKRMQLISQFLTESIVIVAVAMLFAIALVELFLPSFNIFTGKDIHLNFLFSTLDVLYFIVLTFVIASLAGLYPAFYLSGFKPIETFKAKLYRNTKGLHLRRTLVIFQFAISIVVILSTIIIGNQLSFVKNYDLGFNKEQVVVIKIPRDTNLVKQVEAFKSDLLKNPAIKNVGASDFRPGGWSIQHLVMETNGEREELSTNTISIDYDFIPMMEMKIVEGRNFSKTMGSDAAKAYIINESFAKKMGWKDPIGKKVPAFGENNRVIGMLKDFNYAPLDRAVEPLLVLLEPNKCYNLYVRINAGEKSPLKYIESLWKKFDPADAFEFTFLDERLNKLYEEENKMSKVFIYFSSIAILIACLGLFGLSLFSTEQRSKEIGIRKVMGASINSVVNLLSKEFLILVIISTVFAFPISYFIMQKWMQRFAYHIDINASPFIEGGFIAIVIALLTVSFHTLKIAIKNPVESLKYE